MSAAGSSRATAVHDHPGRRIFMVVRWPRRQPHGRAIGRRRRSSDSDYMTSVSTTGGSNTLKKLIAAIALGAAVFPAAAGAASASPGNRVCRQGDQPIMASARTSCSFAGEIINAYVNDHFGAKWTEARLYSPATHRAYRLQFRKTGSGFPYTVTATGPNGIRANFKVY